MGQVFRFTVHSMSEETKHPVKQVIRGHVTNKGRGPGLQAALFGLRACPHHGDTLPLNRKKASPTAGGLQITSLLLISAPPHLIHSTHRGRLIFPKILL